MANKTIGPTKTYKAAADYSAKRFYIVWLAGETATLADDADQTGENIMGAIVNKPSADIGATVEVQMPHGGGTGKVIAGGNIAVGDALTTDGNGKAIVTTTSDDYIMGYALQTAVANDIFEYSPVCGLVD